jgi:serpin B
MMQREGTYRHLLTKSFEAVILPYGAGRVSLYLFLPRSGLESDNVVSELAGTKWPKWQASFRESEGTIDLPRFQAEWGGELGPALISLGMKDAFSAENAQFPNILAGSPRKPFLNRVEHQAVMTVDEEGTEASAATTADFNIETVSRPFHLRFDRPFLALIRDETSGEFLFVTSVTDPN